MSQAPVLKLDQVSKSFESGENSRLEILKNISLELNRGEAVSIVGPSGSGKSTLLNIIGTLDLPDSGRTLINGHDVATLAEKELAALRNQEIGFIFQSHHLLPQCSVLENVLTPTLPLGGNDTKSTERARNLLERVGLTGRIDHRPGQLSGGERQRAAVVRALINSPSLVLADEPTGALDHDSADNLSNLLVELNNEENITLIVVTHSMDLAKMMKRQFTINQGSLTENL